MSAMPTRRAVLGTGFGATALLAGGGGWALSSGRPDEGLLILTRVEHAVVDAISVVLFPGVHFPLDGPQAGVAARVDAIVANTLEPAHASGFRYILRALEWGTLASRGSRFTALSAEERLDVLETWTEPDVLPRRVAGESLRVILGMAYFSHPQIQDAMGWRVGCRGDA